MIAEECKFFGKVYFFHGSIYSIRKKRVSPVSGILEICVLILAV
jgi:hypothetical protein